MAEIAMNGVRPARQVANTNLIKSVDRVEAKLDRYPEIVGRLNDIERWERKRAWSVLVYGKRAWRSDVAADTDIGE